MARGIIDTITLLNTPEKKLRDKVNQTIGICMILSAPILWAPVFSTITTE